MNVQLCSQQCLILCPLSNVQASTNANKGLLTYREVPTQGRWRSAWRTGRTGCACVVSTGNLGKKCRFWAKMLYTCLMQPSIPSPIPQCSSYYLSMNVILSMWLKDHNLQKEDCATQVDQWFIGPDIRGRKWPILLAKQLCDLKCNMGLILWALWIKKVEKWVCCSCFQLFLFIQNILVFIALSSATGDFSRLFHNTSILGRGAVRKYRIFQT